MTQETMAAEKGHSLLSLWRIFRAWWSRYKCVFNTTKYARRNSHCTCCPEHKRTSLL